MDRIGGRAHTDYDTFGIPWDRGCHWLHSADVNPMRDLADQYGFHYLKEQPPFQFRWSERWATDDEVEATQAFVDSSRESIEQAGRSGVDVAISELCDESSPYISNLRTSLAAEWSVDYAQASSADDGAYRDTGNNWPVEEGYGALVARHAAGIP